MRTRLTTDQRLRLYVERANELLQRRFVREGMKSHYSLDWDGETKEATFSANEPDEEDLRAFLLLFRHFISDREPVFVTRTFNDCFRFLKDEHLKEELNKAREAWLKIINQVGAMKTVVDGKTWSGEYVLDLWINGYYFHNDPANRDELRRLLGDTLPLIRVHLIASLPQLTHVIIFLAQVVNQGLEDGLFEFPNEATA